MQAGYGKISSVFWLFFSAFVLGCTLPAAGGAGEFKEEYKLTLNVGPSFYWGMGATRFAELVSEKTHGRINVKPYYSSILLKGAQLQSPQMVAKGVIDCAYESTINTSTVIPEMNIFSLPFFIKNFENLDKIENGATGAAIFEAMDRIGLKGLAWAENGFRQIANSTRIIQEPKDLQGLRIRVVGSPIFIDIFRYLGADPVNMNWADAVTAFRQRVVDGQENPVGVLVPLQAWNFHKYLTFWNYLVDPVIIYWNKEQWEAFPPDIQKAITEAAQESAKFEKALCRAGLDGEKSINILRNEFKYTMEVPNPIELFAKEGMTVTILTEDQVKAFEEATAPVYDAWLPKIGKEIYDSAMADMKQ
ncbi:MAG: DctP family TRAP transporter solute-binding subunit [Desulforhabdus sp.]|jgi:tripartite ATP-independent transporter DctP family solute receptor|nr:DctP family TRAP transporter solute-binding subunit [Desulforhabdus sp.]